MKTTFFHLIGLCLLVIMTSGCQIGSVPVPTNTPSPTATITATPTVTPSPSVTPTITLTPTITPTIFIEPAGCLRPPDDYTLIAINGWWLNTRTYAMLQHAAELYQGQLDITNTDITQGSYHDNGAASFGTHLGGGAVDLSVRSPVDGKVVSQEEIEQVVYALRVAGFAAWYRAPDELFVGSAPHIHAIAIGDAELSGPAELQLTGSDGYFLGFNGLPGLQAPDRHGEPVICQWMIDLGYQNLSP
jgi:hypothetical protein